MSKSKTEDTQKNANFLQFLKDKVFLIVGAENQLGLDLAQIPAELGSEVILAGMNEPLLKEAAKRMVAQKYKAYFICLNPTKPDEVKNGLASLQQRFEHIDYLVINMDFRNNKKINETSWIDWQNHLLINLSAPFLFIKYGFRYMHENSKIIMINSKKNKPTDEQDAAYCSSKAALDKFLQIAKVESKESRVNLIEATFDETTLADIDDSKVKQFYYDAAKQIILALNPMNEASQLDLHFGYNAKTEK